MDTPYIEINGKKIELPSVKARVWRELMQFEEQHKNFKSADSVDKHCEIIAKIFGVTTDDVLDNLDLDEVLPTYYHALNYVVAMLMSKLAVDKKNEIATESSET